MMELSQTAQVLSEHDPLVWYAGYGSNTDLARFMCYIAGGTPVGTDRIYVGCKDPTPPLAHMSLELPYQLYFAGESRVWTGGVAFIGHNKREGGTPTRASAYLIRRSQLEQLVAQENGREEVYLVDLPTLQEQGRLILGDGAGRYDGILLCGMHDNIPIVSITTPVPHSTFNRPAPAYLRIMASGLRSTIHSLTTEEIVAYLMQKPGVVGNYTSPELYDLVS